MTKLDRTKIKIIKKDLGDEAGDDGYIKGEPSYLIGVVRDLTRDAWAFRGEDAERRLQRDVTTAYRRKS